MKTTIIFDKPCVIFSLSDMFTRDVLARCFDEFPLDKRLYQSDEGKKYRIENYSKEMAKIISSSRLWHQVFQRLKSDDILQLLTELEQAEGRPTGKYVFESVNPLKNFVNRYLLHKHLVTQTVEFSLLGNGSFLVPHTDSRNKLITMMMYFPEPQQVDSPEYGTVFHDFSDDHRSKYENFANQHYTETHFPDFYQDQKEIFRTTFSPDKAFGFLKNAYSWHSVPPITLRDGEHRRSINVNVYLMKGSIWKPLSTAIKTVLKRYL